MLFFVKNAKNAKNCVFLQKIVEKKQNKTHIKSEGITHVIQAFVFGNQSEVTFCNQNKWIHAIVTGQVIDLQCYKADMCVS